MKFVLIDQTAGATCVDGSHLSPIVLSNIAKAMTIQLNREFSSEYGGNYEVRVGNGVGDLRAEELSFQILPSLADVPNAIAYHSVNGNGMPILFDGITLSDTVNGQGNSTSVAISHECLETARDEGTNAWRSDDAGNLYCQEIGDPFENRTYPVTLADNSLVWVSDFALESYFIPRHLGPYSYMSKRGFTAVDAPAPLTTTSELGYQMMMPAGGGLIQTSGAMTRRPQTLAHSRRYKRGLRA